MRRQEITLSSATASSAVPLDYRALNFQIGLGAKLSAGASLTYTVQHTFDDVYAPGFVSASATWYDHPNLTARVVGSDGNYAFPITAIRLVVSSYTSGDVTLIILQASGQN